MMTKRSLSGKERTGCKRTVAKMVVGNVAALTDLYELTVAEVFTTALGILRTPSEAHNVVCAVYVHAWYNAAAFDPANNSVLGG